MTAIEAREKSAQRHLLTLDGARRAIESAVEAGYSTAGLYGELSEADKNALQMDGFAVEFIEAHTSDSGAEIAEFWRVSW